MKPFNYVSVFNGTGYGTASIGYANQLAIQNPDLFIHPISDIQTNDINDSVRRALTTKVDLTRPVFCFWHAHDIANQLVSFKGPKVGFTTFELNSLTPDEIKSIQSLDMIGTASTWGASVLENYVPKSKVFVVPHAFRDTPSVSLNVYKPDHDKFIDSWNKILAPITLSNETLLLSSIGKYESRKGFPELIKACIEDLKDRPITLIAFWYNPFIQDGFPYSDIISNFFYPEYTNSGLKSFRHKNFRVILMPPLASKNELHSAALNSDFFIAPSKGEGWNLPLFEMLSYGMPSIATTVTAHKDYTENAVIPIHTDTLEVALDNKFFRGQGSWYKVTKEAIAAAISSVPQYNTQLLSSKAVQNTSAFTWQTEAMKITNLMKKY